jgi:hypothetical protein
MMMDKELFYALNRAFAAVVFLLALCACSGMTEPTPPCDRECQLLKLLERGGNRIHVEPENRGVIGYGP